MYGKSPHSLKNQTVILTAGQLIAYAGNILVGVILVRMISVADYGTFLQVNLVFTTIVSVAVFGLPASLFYFIPQLRQDDIRRFVLQSLFLLLMAGGVTAGVLYVGKAPLSAFMNNGQVEGLIGYVILLVILGLLNETTEPILISIGKADTVAKLNIASTCGLLILAPVVLWQGFGLEGVFMAMAAQYGFKLAVVWVHVARFPGVVWPFLRFREVVDQIRYAVPIASGRVFGVVRPRVDQLMISNWYPPDMFAIYARGAFNLPVVSIVVSNVSNVLLPRFVELVKAGKLQDMFRLWQEAMKQVGLFTLPLFVFFLLYAEEVMVVLFTEAYRSSAIIFVIYLCSIPMELFFYGHLHQAFGTTRHIFIANFLAFPLTILFNIVFHSAWGFIGPAIACLVTKALIIVYQLVIIARYFSVSLVSVFPWVHQGKILILCILAGGLVYPLKLTGAPIIVTLLLSAAIYAVAYIFLLRKFGYLSSSVKEMIRNRLFPAPFRV